MALTATYEPTLSRIRLAADALGATASYATFERIGAGLTLGKVNQFEGIGSGVAVTPENSGSFNQAPFDTVAGTVVASTDSAIIDAKGLRAELAASTESYVRWLVSGTTHYVRAYIRTPAVNSINSRLIWTGTAASAAFGWDIRQVVATDRIGFATRNVNRFSLGIDGVNAPLTPNTVYRIEGEIHSGVAGTAEVRLYDEAGTLLDSDTYAGAIDDPTDIRYGIGNGVNATQVWDLDGIGYGTTGFLGAWQDHPDADLQATVRGGSAVPVVGQAAAVDDYEFPAGEPIIYRVQSFTAGTPTLLNTYTATITQDLDQVWVKVVARPFLNAPVVVQGQGPVTRSARNGVFPVVGRSFPVAISDVRGSRQFALSILTETAAERRDFDLVLASGEPIFLHTPLESKVDDGYFIVGDTTETPTGRISQRRVFELPLTEVAATGPGVVGAAGTWSTVIAAYADWDAVLADNATWADLLELVGDPTEVIVP